MTAIYEMNVPLFLHVEQQQHYDDDVMEHEVSLQVAGAADTKIVGTVASLVCQRPKVVAVARYGTLDLPAEVTDRLLILVFRLLISEMNKDGGWEASWSMADGSKWIRCQFPVEGEQIVKELRRHVRPDVRVRDTCSVTIG